MKKMKKSCFLFSISVKLIVLSQWQIFVLLLIINIFHFDQFYSIQDLLSSQVNIYLRILDICTRKRDKNAEEEHFCCGVRRYIYFHIIVFGSRII